MDSQEKNIHHTSDQENRSVSKKKDALRACMEEADPIKDRSKNIVDAVRAIPFKGPIERKLVCLALTAGALLAATGKPAFASVAQNTLRAQLPTASESIHPPEQRQDLEVRPPGYTYTRQKESISRLYLDKEIVLPLIEKQGLVLTETSIKARNAIIYFDVSENGVYTATALLRAVDSDTVELRVYNSDDTIHIVRFQRGEVVSSQKEKQ